MKKLISLILIAALLAAMLLASASAEVITLNGTVVSTCTETITAALGGTIGDVKVSAGDHVNAGDALAALETVKVYALEDGTVRLFGSVGDSAETVAEKYGAVAYIEPAVRYTVSASTKNAYDDEANRIIHPGETVYLRSMENVKLTGKGIVTNVSGSSYTIELSEHDFSSGENVYIYRSSSFGIMSRIGRGSVSLKDPVTYTGSGIIVKYTAANNGTVKKGDVLFETLSGDYTAKTADLDKVTVTKAGVIASVSLQKGNSVNAGDTVAEFYADENMRIEALVTEEYLSSFAAGDEVAVTFIYLDNGEYTVNGVIEKISRTASSTDEETGEASYSVMIRPESTERLSYGMNAVIEKIEKAAPAEEEKAGE